MSKHTLTLNLNNIIDAKIKNGKIVLITINGKIELEDNKKNRELYWSIKLRNRRKVFGL